MKKRDLIKILKDGEVAVVANKKLYGKPKKLDFQFRDIELLATGAKKLFGKGKTKIFLRLGDKIFDISKKFLK